MSLAAVVAKLRQCEYGAATCHPHSGKSLAEPEANAEMSKREKNALMVSGLLEPSIPEALNSYVSQYIPLLLKLVLFGFLSHPTKSPLTIKSPQLPKD